MSNEELQAQVQRCEKWNDPQQWDALGVLYYERGYLLNALVCFKQADKCRCNQPVVAMEAGDVAVLSRK
jgi:cytochrome c-type biogenesis protein CcmH/NrfG